MASVSSEGKRLEGCVSHKDITVSKLSRLQKQILVHARKAMIAKGQEIERGSSITFCIPAPEWLGKTLTTSLTEIFRSRKIFNLGGQDLLDCHPWLRFFEEIAFLERNIKDAAKEAGTNADLRATELYRYGGWNVPFRIKYRDKEFAFHPWPYIDRAGWHFKFDIEGITAAEAKESIKSLVGEKSGMWVQDGVSEPINCTIPELLRDLFDFPVCNGGHIDALAFSQEAVGKARYNTAQATLRRACSRLAARKLIWERAGQNGASLFQSYYSRSGIGLTETGVNVADKLIAASAKADSADSHRSVAHTPDR
jgi:hypothetical protein